MTVFTVHLYCYHNAADMCKVSWTGGTYRKSKQDRQCMYNVTLRRVREPLLMWKSNKYFLLLSVCVRACVCACAGVRVGTRARWRVHEALLILQATLTHHAVTSFMAPPYPPHFSTLSPKRCDFRKNVIQYKICVLIFSIAFV